MNRCEQIQNRILEGAMLSPEEKDHLNACPDCRTFAAFSARVERVPATEREIPAALDSAILGAARRKVVRKPAWRPVIWKVAFPAAAVFALAAGILFTQHPAQHPENIPAPTVAVTAISVQAQERSFEEQILALASDVGTGADCFDDTMEFMI